MASSVVFKVKYGNTLRRFNVDVNENQKLELDFEGLRAKIRSLFNFTADADLQLTYLDEDLDIVALVDEADLHDVLKQGLNPVRITVQLNAGSAASARSSGTSTPVPAQDQNLNANVNAGVADLLKSVPEPLREPLSKLSTEVASKAASSSPLLSDLIDSFTQASQFFFNPNHPSQSAPANVAPSKEASESRNEPLPGKDPSASADESKRVMQSSSPEWNAVQYLLNNRCDCDLKKTKYMTDKYKRKLARSLCTRPLGIREKGSSSGEVTTDSAASEVKKNPFADTNDVKNIESFIECPFSGVPMPPSTTSVLPKSKSFGPTEGSIFHRGVRCDGCGVLPITGPRFKSKVKDDYDLCHICFEQMGEDSDYIRIDFPAPYRHPWSFKGNPIVPNINSRPWALPPPPFFGRHMKHFRPKLDSRFILDVNVMDGTIMAPKTPFTKIWRMRNNGNLPWTHGTQLLWIGGDKFSPTNSVEIEVPVAGFYPENELDVAVDFIAPELPGRYISYWKMASPSGQKFGQRVWVLIQVDASLSEETSAVPNSLNLNLPPDVAAENLPESLEIGGVEPLVNMEYKPSSVPPTTKMQDPLFNELKNKLNLPDDVLLYDPVALPSSGSSSAPFLPITPNIPASPAIPVFYPHFEVIDPVPATTSRVEIPPQAESYNGVKKVCLDVLKQNVSLPDDVQLYDPVALPSSSSSSAPPQPITPTMPVFYPHIEVNDPAPATTSQAEIPRQNESNNDVEQVLLNELEDMGFKQMDLNKKVLRKNDYDLEQSLDELCNVSQWDLLLEELCRMGFVDPEVNKRVLAKNNGSLKHAVMDLITRENV